MALTTYAQYEEIRAALGVNSQELSDTVLALPVYEMGLVRELNKISTSLPAAFSTVQAIEEDARTDVQQALFESTRLFSVYAAAKQVGVSLASFAPKDISDGKASLSRFTGDSYKETMDRVEAAYLDAKQGLIDTMGSYTGDTDTSSTVPFTTFVVSSRVTDAVTGT
jgi:hypothetical protein